MAKPLIIIYPYLKAEMAFYGHRAEDLGQVLGLKAEAVRKRLRGEVNFTLPEIDKICKFYGKTFEELFGSEPQQIGQKMAAVAAM